MQTLPSYRNIKATTIEIIKVGSIRLHLQNAIHRADSFVLNDAASLCKFESDKI